MNDRISRDNQGWLANLTKPAIYPPDYLFGPVRLIVYTLMGVASYLVYRDGGGFCTQKSRLPLSLYGIQMALSWAWIFIFYWFQSLNWVCKNDCLISTVGILAVIAACALVNINYHKFSYCISTIFRVSLRVYLYSQQMSHAHFHFIVSTKWPDGFSHHMSFGPHLFAISITLYIDLILMV